MTMPIAISTVNFEKKDNLSLSKARAAVAPLTCNGRKSADTHSDLKKGIAYCHVD